MLIENRELYHDRTDCAWDFEISCWGFVPAAWLIGQVPNSEEPEMVIVAPRRWV